MSSFKKILTAYEETTYSRLLQVCDVYGAHVYPKVRLADVLPIAHSGITDDEFRYALQSHFDFLAVNMDYEPLFTVEFDDPSHKDPEVAQRDQKKNNLCERFSIPLLRINSRYLLSRYRDMDLLSYFVEVWFLSKVFDDAQESGDIPADEPFDPTFIIRSGGRQNFPLWLSMDIVHHTRRLFDAGKVYDPGPSHFVGVDTNGTYHALAYLRITEDSGIAAETAMRNQLFPISISDVLADIATRDLYDRLTLVLDGQLPPEPASDIDSKVRKFNAIYEMCCSSTFSEGPPQA